MLLSSPRFNEEGKSRFKVVPVPCPAVVAPSSQSVSEVCDRRSLLPVESTERGGRAALPSPPRGLDGKGGFSAAASAARATLPALSG